jgi:CRP/FNR family transcriptional regulator, cyclic AMP receptor protein
MNDVTRAPSGLPGPRPLDWPGRTVLGALSASSREALLSAGTLRQYPAGGTLFLEGDSSTYVVVLIDGWAKVTGATEEGGQALLALRSSGDLVGEQAALEDEPRSASVISAGATVGREIRQAEFLRLITEHPDLAMAITRSLSAKLRWSTRRRIEYSGLPVPVRLARVLSEIARLDGRPTRDGIELGFGLTQPEFAAMVGASEPSVHRAMRRFRQAGLIETGYRRIVIRDPRALNATAGSAWTGGPPTAGPAGGRAALPSACASSLRRLIPSHDGVRGRFRTHSGSEPPACPGTQRRAGGGKERVRERQAPWHPAGMHRGRRRRGRRARRHGSRSAAASDGRGHRHDLPDVRS